MSTLLSETPNQTSRSGGKFLTFALGSVEYGLEILTVREILGYLDITAMPRTPGFVKGVINLRGQVIVIIDLRAKFELPPVAKTDQTCIIVVEIQHGGRKVSTGIMVDHVSEVLEIAGESIEDAPTFGSSAATDCILGMGKVGKAVKILLDINKVLDGEAITQITKVCHDKNIAPLTPAM